MEKSIEMLWSKLDDRLKEQTATITTAVTQNIMEAIDEKLKNLSEENTILKTKISTLEQKLANNEREKRKQNLVFFGVQEQEKSELELVDYIKEIVIETGTQLESHEITKVHRVGQRSSNKNRPVIVTLGSVWKKHIIMRNKARLAPGINVKEDLPKEVIEKRKQLQPQLEEERKKGNWAYFKYDKLIIKKYTDSTRDKRKREESISPNAVNQKKTLSKNKSPTNPSTKTVVKEIVKPNILNYIERGRALSLSELPKN
uniref:SFRICE_041038 n=1 Tax=Spodoptera frugiperda TaxID=7108 RepID=A0A2H1V475_SPOFR